MKNNTIGFLALTVLLLITGFFSLNLYFRQRDAHDQLDVHLFPYTIGEWRGKDLPLTQKEYDILETHNLISREYVNPKGENVYLFIIYSETNRTVFHPPEVCMMGGGLKIVDKRAAVINSPGYKFSVNKLDMQKDNYRGMALYCYKAGNIYTANFYLQQAAFAINQLLGNHKGGATIRVSMALKENEEKTLSVLTPFLIEAIKIINSL